MRVWRRGIVNFLLYIIDFICICINIDTRSLPKFAEKEMISYKKYFYYGKIQEAYQYLFVVMLFLFIFNNHQDLSTFLNIKYFNPRSTVIGTRRT